MPTPRRTIFDPCAVAQCSALATQGKTLCSRHEWFLRTHGRMPVRRNFPLRDRALSKIDKDPDTGCWEWTGSRGTAGYGRISVDNRPKHAHRVVYELLVGEIPNGLELDHLCRNRGCVNPDHLEPVTHGENMRRGKHTRATDTHCANGHLWADDNVRYYSAWRTCATCIRDGSRERQRARRAKSQVA